MAMNIKEMDNKEIKHKRNQKKKKVKENLWEIDHEKANKPETGISISIKKRERPNHDSEIIIMNSCEKCYRVCKNKKELNSHS